MFVITMLAYNAERYIKRSIESALFQELSEPYRIVVIDDCSTDSTPDIIADTAGYLPASRIAVLRNPSRVGILANHVQAAGLCDDDDTIVVLDGDDQLAHPGVLRRVQQEYADPDVWMTYGSFEYDHESRNPNGDCRGIAQQIPREYHNRRYPFVSSHLRTYKAWLFKRIEEQDLKRDGEYHQCAADYACMFPMIEMAGPDHARYIHDILYLYNSVNPLNEHKDPDKIDKIMETARYICSQRIYPRLLHKEASPWT